MLPAFRVPAGRGVVSRIGKNLRRKGYRLKRHPTLARLIGVCATAPRVMPEGVFMTATPSRQGVRTMCVPFQLLPYANGWPRGPAFSHHWWKTAKGYLYRR